MDTILLLLGLTVVPLVINKTTERGRLEFVHEWLREIWICFCILYTYYVITKPEMREFAMSFYVRNGLWSYAIVFVLGGVLLCFYWWSTGKLLNETSSHHPAVAASGSVESISRISALISEGNSLQVTCQSVPDSYNTPVQNRADLGNAIVNWKQRVENVLSFDSDPRPLQMWKQAILYSTPQKIMSIAIYCTELNVKMDVLNRVLGRKTMTPQQRIGQLSRFISEGNSIKQGCIDGDKFAFNQENQWMTKVMQWLGDNFDDNYAQDFNHALYPSIAMPGTHPAEFVAVWRRMQARGDVLSNIKQEIASQE
jgi:hypothetical protein